MALTDKLTAIADAIRGKTGKEDALTLDQMPSEIEGIQTGGGENILDYATGISRMFVYQSFETGTELEVSFGSKVSTFQDAGLIFSNTFYRTVGLKKIKINVNNSAFGDFVYSLNNTFEDASKDTLETIDLTGLPQPMKVNGLARAFYRSNWNFVLKEILGEFDCTKLTSFSRTFDYCSGLETIRFTPGTIKVSLGMGQSQSLSDASIQSIIEGLADLTGGTAQTLSLHATVGAKLTDEQKAAISAKNWTVTY